MDLLPEDPEKCVLRLSRATVGVFAIFAFVSLIFPAFGPIKITGKDGYAKSDVVSIVIALKVYLIEYEAFPRGDSVRIMHLILNNPRNVPLFDGRAEQFNQFGEYLDPWGSPVPHRSLPSGWAARLLDWKGSGG